MFWSSSDQSLFNQGNDSHENVLLFQPSFSDYPDIRWPLVVWWLRVFFDDCDAVHFPKDAFGQRCGILHNWWCPHGSVCRFRNPNAVEKSLPSCAKPTRTWGKQECPSLLGCSMSSAGTPFDIQVCVIVRFGVKQMSRLYSDSFRVTQLPFPPSRTNTFTDNGETSLTRLILSFFKPFFFFFLLVQPFWPQPIISVWNQPRQTPNMFPLVWADDTEGAGVWLNIFSGQARASPPRQFGEKGFRKKGMDE